MAVEFDGITVPESTNTVPTPGPVESVQTPGHPESTGAVETPGAVTHEFGALGQEPTAAAPNPEPVTVYSAFAKVVRPQGRRAAEPATTTGSTKAQQPASGDALPGVSGH